MTHRFAVPLLLIALACPTLAQATRPEAVKTDYSTPRATLETLLRAVQEVDEDTLRASLEIPPAQKDQIDLFIKVHIQSSRLQQAATRAFGADGTAKFGDPRNALLATRLKAIKPEDITEKSDTATVSLRADDAAKLKESSITLKKSNGLWKIDGDTAFPVADKPEITESRLKTSKTLLDIIQKTQAKIATGQFPSAQDAYRDFMTQWSTATNTPAPASQPATSPAK